MQLCSLYWVGSNMLQTSGKFSLFSNVKQALYTIHFNRMIQKVYSLSLTWKVLSAESSMESVFEFLPNVVTAINHTFL